MPDKDLLWRKIILCFLCSHALGQFEVVLQEYLNGDQLDLVRSKESSGTGVTAPPPGEVLAGRRDELVLVLDFVLQGVWALS